MEFYVSPITAEMRESWKKIQITPYHPNGSLIFEDITLEPPNFNFDDYTSWPEIIQLRVAANNEKERTQPGVGIKFSLFKLFGRNEKTSMSKSEKFPKSYVTEEVVYDDWSLVNSKKLYKDVVAETDQSQLCI